MVTKALAVVLFSMGSLLAQTAVIVNDSKGNQAIATLVNGSVYFRDNNGNIAVGTMQGGNVFLNTNNGEVIFGSIKDGNVHLTDQKGSTTGTIRNGNIFLNNSDGSVTTGTYNRFGIYTSTTGTPPDTTQQQQQSEQQLQLTQQRIRQRQQDAYNLGYNAGSAIGAGIVVAIERHKLTRFCNANPSAVYINNQTGYYSGTLCKNAPFTQAQQDNVDSYCKENPGKETGYGLHTVTCFNPPTEPNLQWARWEMNGLQSIYKAQTSLNSATDTSQLRGSWDSWKLTYCRLAKPGASYKNLEGKKQRCD